MIHYLILDVRTPVEYRKQHIPDAINFPVKLPPISQQERAVIFNNLAEFLAMKRIPKNTLVLVYCKKGIRSKMIADFLNQLGYQSINLGGVYP